MTSPYLRPLPVLALLLCVAIAVPAVFAGIGSELWDSVACCSRDLGDGLGLLRECETKKVARAATRTCCALTQARDGAEACDGIACFKALKKMAKKARKALRVADRKGYDTAEVRLGLESLRVAARKIVEAGIAELKDRPDFETNDAVVKAVVKAEAGLEAARDALSGKKPFVGSFDAYRRAFKALFKFL